MSEFKHTPGPWHYSETATHATVIDENNDAVFHDDKRIPGVVRDARLIAAAPVLLEALKLAEEMLCKQENAMRSMGRYEPCPEVAILTARAAIVKALGEQS